MKRNFYLLLAVFISCLPFKDGAAQCIATSAWQSASAPTDNLPLEVSACNYAGEYNTITNIVSGKTYRFTSSISTDWLTITTTANAVLAQGTTPVTWVATFSGTVRVHIFANSSCGTQSSCRSQYVSCTSCLGGMGPGYFVHPTTGLQNAYLGTCMVNLDCGSTSTYYDNGGPSGNYSNYIDQIYRTFCPSMPGKCVKATVTSMDIENSGTTGCYDYLLVGNGPTQNSAYLWGGCRNNTTPNTLVGSWNGGTWTSTDASGCLAFTFYSDGSATRSGWNISLSCVNCSQANYQVSSECEGAIPCCGNVNFAGASTGPGIKSTCSGCIISEHYTTWYYFEIAQSGTLGMTLTPNNLGNYWGCTDPDDYDFALFRTDNCSNLGAPIRCSYAYNNFCYDDVGPYTGMVSYNPYAGGSVTDQSEDVLGDGFVTPLNVTAGQTYFLMVNGWSPSDMGYNLSFVLTNGASFTNCNTLPPLPVELLNYDVKCKNGHGNIQWSTASETNNDYFTILKSNNGFMFKKIGQVMGQGNSNNVHFYSFYDDEIPDGPVYYQLKQTDFDGKITAFNPIPLVCSTENSYDINIFPNPFKNQLVVKYSDLPEGKAKIKVYDILGKIIIDKEIDVFEGNRNYNLDLENLSNGLYDVEFSTGDINFHKKIIKD
jgi:hypothetical protein